MDCYSTILTNCTWWWPLQLVVLLANSTDDQGTTTKLVLYSIAAWTVGFTALPPSQFKQFPNHANNSYTVYCNMTVHWNLLLNHNAVLPSPPLRRHGSGHLYYLIRSSFKVTSGSDKLDSMVLIVSASESSSAESLISHWMDLSCDWIWDIWF